MTKQVINIGLQGNDGSGESIRESFRKVNENFDELYALYGLSEVLRLTIITVPPINPNAGIIAVADGVIWDPASKNGNLPYPVFYNGTTWNAFY